MKLTVVNEVGKQAVITILGPNDFFGEGCLAGQSVRIGTATAMTPSTVHVIEKSEMLKALHEQHTLSNQFIAFMLALDIRIEEDLVDQLLPKVSQEALAEIVGTTRSSVNFFMNKFRKLGLIKSSSTTAQLRLTHLF